MELRSGVALAAASSRGKCLRAAHILNITRAYTFVDLYNTYTYNMLWRSDMLSRGLSAFIRQRRKELGLTQKEFAERYQISIRALRSLEQGSAQVLLSSAQEILNALGYELIPGEFAYAKSDETVEQYLSLEEVIERLRTYKPTLDKKFSVAKIGVFGSLARQEQKPGSDVDLLVEFKQKPSLRDEASLLEFLKRILSSSRIDLVRMERVDPDFLKSIEKDLRYA